MTPSDLDFYAPACTAAQFSLFQRVSKRCLKWLQKALKNEVPGHINWIKRRSKNTLKKGIKKGCKKELIWAPFWSILASFFIKNVVLGRPCAPRGLQEGGDPLQRGKRDQKSSKRVPKSDKKAIKNAINMLYFLHFLFSSSVVFCFSPSPLLRYSFYSVLFRSLPVQVYIYIYI